jgi:FkbM family methyltransferase
MSSSTTTYPKPEGSPLAHQGGEFLAGMARFVRDSALLSRSQQTWRDRIRIWNGFCKASAFSSKKSGVTKLAGFHISYFDQPTLLYLYREIFVRQTYWFAAESASPVILDCGANLGMATLFFKSLFPASQIQCFEPDPTTFALLERNLSANRLTGITSHNLALWNEDTEVPFFCDPAAPGNLLMSTNANRAKGLRTMVAARRLSAYIEGQIDLLKLDVEGAELRVLQELADSGTISRIRQMIIEYHHKIPGESSSMSRMLRILEDEDFEYQITASGFPLARPERFQDVMIYAYQR